ncbi:MAG: tRNA (guanosine(46)-N7)-methyltransferase TrmB [Acidiferrobacter sp.]
MNLAGRREVRSFTRRERPLGQAALATHERLGERLSLPEAQWAHLGEGPRDVVLDIGFGDGESLLTMAAGDPGRDYVGIEVYRTGIIKVMRGVEAQGLANVRLIEADVHEFLGKIGDRCIAAIQVFFPDPWPKTRHHKRRLVQERFLKEVVRVLRTGGLFHMATDWAPYAEAALDAVRAFPSLAPEDEERGARPCTRFERRGLRLGHEVRDLRFRKTP